MVAPISDRYNYLGKISKRWLDRRNVLIASSCLLFFCVITWFHNSTYIFSGYKPLPEEIISLFDRPEECLGPSRLVDGIPGFYVFENLWYRNGAFYLFASNPEEMERIPNRGKIMSGSHELFIHPLSETEGIRGQDRGKIRCYSGQNIFLNDGADKKKRSYLDWFYHLAAEDILGGIASLSIAFPNNNNMTMPFPDNSSKHSDRLSRLLIPWESRWKDHYGLNDAMVRAMFGGDSKFVDKSTWDVLGASKDWIGFQRVVVVDRYASHRYNNLANEWNKMSLPIFLKLQSNPLAESIFKAYREKVLNNLHLEIPPSRAELGKSIRKSPKIVYLERQETKRRIEENDNQGLLEVLKQLELDGRAAIELPHLSKMSFGEQVNTVKDADIIIGVHGNGLTHQLWMPEGGVVIELFVPNSFLRDYQILSQVLGHQHIAIWDDRVLPTDEWEPIKGELNPKFLHDGKKIPLDTAFIRGLLEDLLVEMSSQRASRI